MQAQVQAQFLSRLPHLPPQLPQSEDRVARCHLAKCRRLPRHRAYRRRGAVRLLANQTGGVTSGRPPTSHGLYGGQGRGPLSRLMLPLFARSLDGLTNDEVIVAEQAHSAGEQTALCPMAQWLTQAASVWWQAVCKD